MVNVSRGLCHHAVQVCVFVGQARESFSANVNAVVELVWITITKTKSPLSVQCPGKILSSLKRIVFFIGGLSSIGTFVSNTAVAASNSKDGVLCFVLVIIGSTVGGCKCYTNTLFFFSLVFSIVFFFFFFRSLFLDFLYCVVGQSCLEGNVHFFFLGFVNSANTSAKKNSRAKLRQHKTQKKTKRKQFVRSARICSHLKKESEVDSATTSGTQAPKRNIT